MPSTAGIPSLFLVEDDPAVLRSLTFLLETEGFSVTGFESAEAFLRAEIDLADCCLVTDQVLPGMSGLDLITHLRAAAPTLPAILLLSSLPPSLRRRPELATVVAIDKPVLGEALVEAIRALSGPPAATPPS